MDAADIKHAWARIHSGPKFEACMKWQIRRDAAAAKAAEIAAEVGADPNGILSCGTRVEGFSRLGTPPVGWQRAGKKFAGFIKPNARTATGKAVKARLDAIHWETPESLAHDLGLPPFFGGMFSGFCSAATLVMRGGVFFVELPAVLVRHLVSEIGVETIQEWEYVKARDTK